MPKITWEDGREEEITISGGGFVGDGPEYFKFTIVENSKERLRDDLKNCMQMGQRNNFLPYEIVEGMLHMLGRHEFADDFRKILLEVHKKSIGENPIPYIDNTIDKFFKKWGLRS